MPTPRFNFGTCVVDGKVFAIGGDVDKFGDISVATVEMYDPETDTWERKADMPTARTGVATLVVDGKIYAIGGGASKKFQRGPGWGYGGKLLPTIEMYDPGTDTWIQKADMPVPRSGRACVVDGKIYIIGGSAANKKQGRLDSVDVYDPATDTWAEVKSMNHARGVSAVSVVDGKIYVIGGVGWPQIPNHPGPPLSSVEVYDPKNNRWTEIAEMPTSKALHTASVIDGKIYVIGGGFWDNDRFIYLSTVEIYDPETDRWTREPDMPTRRSGHRTEVVNGNIYIFGGSNDAFKPLTTVDVYHLQQLMYTAQSKFLGASTQWGNSCKRGKRLKKGTIDSNEGAWHDSRFPPNQWHHIAFQTEEKQTTLIVKIKESYPPEDEKSTKSVNFCLSFSASQFSGGYSDGTLTVLKRCHRFVYFFSPISEVVFSNYLVEET